ncbi:Protein of unknown function, DUF547 [Hymenobacter daecheongensis DSM 21074]|uniref:DUF547 domain-containing protein n=1 Tax=Hymenobacter daecheongensis DSM 21074 TaxID=1121955 RepID=A0A1M6G4E7_9BACT|nr:DUF547 domain-containing protein [Hymenobacter daecheongensis]SHJ04764.1 Protein of unknown function, DUF547 [Hymenobacter daecheongensis DSM 21074]
MRLFSPLRWLLLIVCLGLLVPQRLRAANVSSRQLHHTWNELLAKHITNDGHVDYAGFLDDEDKLDAYLQTIRKTPPDEQAWSRNDQQAYWLNVYNAATVYMVLQYYPVTSMNEIKVKTLKGSKSAWEAPSVTVGTRQYSLNQIEREVLRTKFQDPRVHFALVCAAETCPPLLNEAYDGARLNQQLDDQARRFLNTVRFNQLAPDHVRLSSVFDWYSAEFGEGNALIAWLNRYATVKIAPTAKVDFLPFDWALNDRSRQAENQALR